MQVANDPGSKDQIGEKKFDENEEERKREKKAADMF